MIQFACPVCRAALEQPEQAAGSDLSCPTCNQRVRVPAPSFTPAVMSAPPPAPPPAAAAPQPAGTQIACPLCARPILIPAGYAGRFARCPHCGGELALSAPAPAPAPAPKRPYYGEYDDARSAPRRRRYEDDDYDDYDDRPRRRRRRRYRDEEAAPGSSAGMICSILSIIFGCVAFLLCPPLFGIAGLCLGIVGTVQSENKVLGILGIVLSVLGTALGMALGILLWGGWPGSRPYWMH